VSTLPERWVRLYTAGLPPAVRDARCDEIASDVFEHCAHRDATHHAVRLELAGRTLRGAAGDLLWRYEEGRAMRSHRSDEAGRPTGLQVAWATLTQAWFTPIAALVALFDILMAVGIAFDENSKMPGQLIGPLLMVLLAIGIITGLWMRWRSQFDDAATPIRDTVNAPRSVLKHRFLLVAAVVAIAAGLVIVSPVLLVAGILTLALTGLLAFRRGRDAREGAPPAPRRASPVLADVLIIVGTFPALALWWMIVPALLALIVIAGVIGTGPRLRRAAAT